MRENSQPFGINNRLAKTTFGLGTGLSNIAASIFIENGTIDIGFLAIGATSIFAKLNKD